MFPDKQNTADIQGTHFIS